MSNLVILHPSYKPRENQPQKGSVVQMPLSRRKETTRPSFEETASDLFNAGVALQEKKDTQGAIELYTRALECDGNYAGAWVNTGAIRWKEGHYPEARICFLRALAIDRKYPMANFNLAHVYDDLGDKHKAEIFYRRAYRLGNLDATFNLALLLFERSDYTQAYRFFAEYWRYDKTSKWGNKALSHMSFIKKQMQIAV